MPGGTDKITKDVRASLRECAAKGGKYFKGTAALFLRSGTEYVGSQVPTITGMVDMNRELLQDTAKFLRNPVDSVNRTINKAMGTDDFKALSRFAKNALDDLKTGNLYDPDRVRGGFGEGMDDLLDTFGDFDMSGFDEAGDWSEPEGGEDWEKEVKIAEAQEGAAGERTKATIDAIGAGTQAIVSTENANAQANIRLSLRQHSQIMAAAQNMVTQQAAAVQAVNQTATSILDVTRETHRQLMDSMKGITALLTKIEQNTAPPVQEKDKVRDTLEIFGTHGEVNVKNLVKSAKKKMDDKYHISSMISMATGGMSIADLLDTVGNDPWQLVTDAMFRKMLPDSLKRQFETTGKKLEGFFPALLTKWADAGKKFDSGESEDLKDFFKGLLGYDERSRKFIDPSMKNVTAPTVFTNKTAKAIEEVIPALISQLHTDLTGDRLKSFNYGTGKFEDVVDVISRMTHDANDLANHMGEAASEFTDLTRAVKFTDAAQQERFEKFRYQYLQKAAEESRFIDPFKDREEFRKTMPSSGNVSDTELFSDIIQQALLNMDRRLLEQIPAEIIDTRQQRNARNASIHNRLREEGQMIAFSGLLDQRLEDMITSDTKKVAGGVRGDALDKIIRKREEDRAKAGLPKANNVVLNGIRSILERGIITYTYIMGNNSAGFDANVSANMQAAIKASDKEWSAQHTRDENARKAETRESDRLKAETERRKVKAKDPSTPLEEMMIGGDETVDWTRVSDRMRYFRINRAQRENGELVIDNPDIIRYERQTPEGARRTLQKRMARLSSEINGRLDDGSIGGLTKKVREYGKVPFELVENGLKMVDSFLFRVLYGEDASDVLLDEHKLPSVLDAVRLNVKAEWLSAKSWFGENIGDPLKHALLDDKDGLIPRIGNRLNEVLIEPLKNRGAKLRDSLIGTRPDDTLITADGRTLIKNSAGKWIDSETKRFVSAETVAAAKKPGYSGGRFSDQINRIQQRAGELTSGKLDQAKAGAKGFLSRLMYGDFAESSYEGGIDGNYEETKKGVRKTVTKRWVQDEDYPDNPMVGEWVDDIQYEYSGFIGGVRKSFSKLQEIMFGPDENGDDHGSRAKFDLVKRELKQAAPDMAIGAGLGVIGSLFLPGGPVLGALLGSAGGFIASSDAFKDVVFGKLGEEKDVPEFNWETGKFDKTKKVRERSGGWINGEIVEAFKKFAPKIAIGSGLGIVGSLFLPGGPMLGALMGSIGGMTVASDRMKQLLFGTYVDENGNEQDGLFGPKTRDAIKNAAGPALGGAALGGAAWSMVSSLGIIPGLSLLPGGPIFTLLGGITGAMNADAIKNFFFGEESDVVTTDPETGKQTKSKKRIGGLFGKAFDFARDNMLKPFTERINAAGAKVGEWFTASVVTPFQHAIQPMKDQFKRAGEAISDSMKNIGQHIKDSITNMFNGPEDSPGAMLKKFFKENIISPLDKLVSGIFNTIGKVIGGIVSAPFKAMELMFAGTVGGKTLDEISDEKARKKNEERKAREKARAERMAGRRNNRLSGILTGFKDRVAGLASKYGGDSSGTARDRGDGSSDTKISGDGGNRDDKNSALSEMRDAIARAEANRGPSRTGVDVARNRNAQRQDAAAHDARDRATEKAIARHRRKEAKGRTDSVDESESSTSTASTATAESATGKERSRAIKGKSNNTYLKEISRFTSRIYDEIKGQLGGLGWNTAYIKAAIDKKWGNKGKFLSDEELPEEMEGSKSVKKRRGFVGKVIDRVGGFFGGVGDKVSSLVEGVVNTVLTPFRAIGKAVEVVKDGVLGAGKALLGIAGTLGGMFKELAIGAAKGLGSAIAGAGRLIYRAAGGVGEALGSMVSMLAGVLHDGVLAISGLVSGAIQFAGAMIPEIGMGIWKGIKFLGSGAAKVAGVAWKGVKGAAGLAWKGAKGIAGGIKNGASSLVGKITGKGKDKDGTPAPVKNVYPIAISTKKDGKGRVQFPLINMAMPVKPTRAVPVYLVGAFKDAVVSISPKSGSDGSNNTDPNANTNTNTPLPLLPGTPDPGATGGGAAPAPDSTNVSRARVEAQRRVAEFKRRYFSVDKRAENSGNPAEEYDRAMQSARSDEEIRAIQASQQMNANSNIIATTGSGGEEKKSFLDSLIDMVTGGGGLSSIFGGKGGIVSKLAAMFGGSKVAGMVAKAGGALGIAGDFLKTGFKGTLPIALGTMVGKATGTEDRGVTNTPKFIARVIQNLFTDKNTVDAATGAVTRLGWGTRIANGAHELGKKLLGNVDAVTRGLPGAVDDVAEAGAKSGLLGKAASFLGSVGSKAFNAAKGGLTALGGKATTAFSAAKNSSGLVGKVLTAICDTAKKVVSHPLVKKLIPSNLVGKMSKVLNKFKTKLGTALVGVTTESLEQFAKKLGIIVTVVTAAYDVVSGYNEAANILKIDSSNLTVPMRLAAGLAKGLSGLAFGLIPVSWLTETIYKIFGSDEAGDSLDAQQAAFKEAAAAAGMSLDEYNRQQNKTTWRQITDGAAAVGNAAKKAGSTVVNVAKDAGSTVANAGKQALDWAGGLLPWNWGKGPGDPTPQVKKVGNPLFEYVKSVVSSAVSSVKQVAAGNRLDTNSVSGFFSSALNNPKSLMQSFMSIGQGVGSSLIDMVSSIFRDKKKAPTIFSIMGEGLGNSLVADLKNTEGKKATISNAMSTAMAATTTAATTGTPVKTAVSTAKKFVNTVKNTGSKLLSGLFGKGPGCDTEWGTGPVTPMSQSSGKWNQDSNSIAKTGCGPTAAAMVASAYGAKGANPAEADKLSKLLGMRASDGGTNPEFYNKYAASHGFGMKQGPVDGARITNNLKAGQPVVMMGKGGAYGKNMHYMVAEKTKGGSVGIVDPLTGGRKSTTMGKLLRNTSATVYSYGKGAWGKGYEDDVENYDENGNLKGVYDQEAATSAKKSGGNPLNKEYRISSGFGYRNLGGNASKYHKGIDLVPKDGSGQAEVGSRWNGKIAYVVRNVPNSHTGLNVKSNLGGNMVWIKTDEGYTVKHMHLKHGTIPDAIVEGAKVTVGQKLGEMGTTGCSTGPHLHYQIEDQNGKPFDPSSSASGGETMSSFTKGAISGVASAVTGAVSSLTNSGNSSGGGFMSTAGNVLSALGTVFSSVAGGIGNLLTILMGGTPGDSDMEGDNGGTETAGTTGGSIFNFGTSAGTISATESKNRIWKWLRKDYGLTEEGASGLMGCWEHESGNRADRIEGDYLKGFPGFDKVLQSNATLNDYVLNVLFPAYDRSKKSISKSGYKMADGNYYPGVGLAQWTKGRAYNLFKFAKERGEDWRNLDTQLAFFKHETDTSYKGLKNSLNSASTPEEGARAGLDGFEMYKGWSSTERGSSQWKARAKSAAQIYNTYHGKSLLSEEEQKQVDAGRARRNWSVNANGETIVPGSTGAGPGETDFEWGTGGGATPSDLGANVQAMNRQITQINRRMEKVRDDATKDSAVVEVTKKITEAISGAGEGSDKTEKLLAGMVAMMGQVVEHLAAIRENTEKKDDRETDTGSPYPKARIGNPVYPNGDREVEDVGAAAINRMTGI